MTPATVSGLAQSLPLFSGTRPDSPHQEVSSGVSPGVKETASMDDKPAAVDTVSLSDQSRQAVTDAREKAPLMEETRKEKEIKESALLGNNEKLNRVAANIQFVYDEKGALKVRYMDNADRLIYQVPSELMLRLKEAAAKSDSSVNTKA